MPFPSWLQTGRLAADRKPRPRLEQLEERAVPATLFVNSTSDASDVFAPDGTALGTRDGYLTLREAILVSNGTLAATNLTAQETAQIDPNTSAARNTITFQIADSFRSAGGAFVIRPTSPFLISAPVDLNGYSTALGASQADGSTPGLNAKLVIELDGSGLLNQSPWPAVLTVTGNDTTVRGLAIRGHGSINGVGLWIKGGLRCDAQGRENRL